MKTSNASTKHAATATHRFVHAPHATVHCGPAGEYYPTGRLNRGTPVEVYIETTDGWSGIRPPEGSHDWIPADAVYLLPGGKVAEASVDRVPAWIGADSPKNEKLLYQTELIKTQSVSILGEAYRGNDADRKLWFRIAPPAGEFRWVRTEHLGSDPIPKAPPQESIAANPPPSKPTSKLTGSGVRKAAYRPPDTSSASTESDKERSASGDSAAIDGNLVWSDEAEQVAKVDREIEREQQSAMQSAKRRASNKTRSDAKSQRETADGKSASKKQLASPISSLISFSTTPEESPEQPPVQRPPVARPPKPVSRPITAPESDAQYWQSMQRRNDQQRAGRAPSGAMDNVLGLLGISVIDPSAESPTSMQPIPRDARPHGQRPTPRSMAYDSPSAVLQRYDPSAGSRLSHLPRPRGRYAASSSGSQAFGEDTSALASQSARDNSLLTSILNSREPLWGNHQERGLLDAPSRPPIFSPETETETASGGPFRTASYSSPTRSPTRPSEANDWEQPERFQSPQIQEALLQLTAIVSRPTREWQLNPVRDTAVFWIERGETPLVRGEARLLLDRIDRFESIRQRSLAFGDTPSATWSTQTPSSQTPSSQTPSSQTPSMLAQSRASIPSNSYPSAYPPTAVQPNQFSVSNASSVSYAPTAPYTEAVPQRVAESGGEMSGWLQAVHTSYPGQPEFALTDDAGNVLAYVRSTPGLNLRRYMEQPVTVFGTRGYIPNLAAKQIIADRVVRLK